MINEQIIADILVKSCHDTFCDQPFNFEKPLFQDAKTG